MKHKERVKISLGIPMYNELIKGHLHETLNNAIDVGFDDIVVLDDGSTDGSWVVLQDYAKKYNNIRIFRHNSNSVISRGNNRWKFVVDRIAEKEPDWVVIRAADQIYSHAATVVGGDLFRKKLTDYYNTNVDIVKIPLIHLWRSRTWYRNDKVWGRDANSHSKSPIWRFSNDYSYDNRLTTGTHMGWHHPSNFGYGRKPVVKDINIDKKENWHLVVIHLGHTTHTSKVLKFRWSMDAAEANHRLGSNVLMPPPSLMLPVHTWLKYNGYKGFYEFNISFKKVNPKWFAGDIFFDKEEPVIESMYYTILEYNKKRAEEYLRLFNKFCKDKQKDNNVEKKFEGEIS
jgi:glycosyltransferase involved in cell wall biosynthesis